MTRRAKIVQAGAALVLAASLAACGLLSVTKSSDQASYYFRLKADYSHDGQPVNFDIVVACSVRVDRSRGGDSGFLAARYPRFFVKETHDGHAVMQIVPIACRGETTANGIVPKDFLPGVIWFERPGDYRFGIAYVSEDAFENPNGQLKFHGASIEKATHEDWMKFEKGAATNEGMRGRYYGGPSTEEDQRIARERGREVEANYAAGCQGVSRLKLSEAGRRILQKYWPANRPRYWTISKRDEGPWPELLQAEKDVQVFADGLNYRKHLSAGNYQYGGFPTRLRGGMFYSYAREIAPSNLFPARDYRGAPWARTEEAKRSKYFVKDVEIKSGPGPGVLYCFSRIRNFPSGQSEPDFRAFEKRERRIRIDGAWVFTANPKFGSWPNPFFENDQYLLVSFNISLS